MKVKMEFFPKPDKKNINGIYYRKSDIDKVLENHSEEIRENGNGFLTMDDTEFSINISNVIGTYNHIFEESGEYYVIINFLEKNKILNFLSENEISDKYVVAWRAVGNTDDNPIYYNLYGTRYLGNVEKMNGLMLLERKNVQTNIEIRKYKIKNIINLYD